MLDLVIRGGEVVTPMGVGVWDVAVRGEKIVAVTESSVLVGEVGRVIDASGMVVVSHGVFSAAPAGRLLPRKIDHGVTARPAC